MAIIYRSNVHGDSNIKDLNALRNCKLITRYTLEQLIMLTGIQAIHDINEVLKYAAIIVKANYQEVGVFIQTKTLNLDVRIATNTDTNGNEKIIEDLFIRIFPPNNKKGRGTAIFLAQVATATSLGFKRIVCEPHGNIDTMDEAIVKLQYNGYFTWGRLGFTMVLNSESYRKYKAQLISHNIELLPLHRLLKKQGSFCSYFRKPNGSYEWERILEKVRVSMEWRV